MPLRTVEEFVAGLRDTREVYVAGRRVPDVTEHPALRIVVRRADGIVVQGAKAHTTMAPVADELIVLPTRSLGEADADYAVAFAIPIATEGLKMICGPLPDPDRPLLEQPVSGRNVEI